MARPRRKRSALDRALHGMKPNRVTARFASGGRYQTWTAIAKAPFKAKAVHMPKSGRRAYQQRMARERKARAAEGVKQRKQATANQKAARAQVRKEQPRAKRATRQPIAVNPRTGKPITWREAQAGMRQAERELKRIEAELAGKKPTPRTRRAKAAPAPKTPLQRAIEDVAKARKPAPKKPARNAAKGRRGLIPYAPIPAGAAPQPVSRPGRNVRGIAMAASCECHGTGRIPVYVERRLSGTTSCPVHGRGGERRGAKRLTTKRAIRDSGLPGLAKWLGRRRTKQRGNADSRQLKAKDQARRQIRHAGPTRECPRPTCEGGLVDKWVTLRLRKQHEDDARTDAVRLVRAAEAHNARVRETGDGKEMKVPKMPDERRLRKASRLEFPHSLCPTCGGLGVVKTDVRLRQDGSQPVAEWRVGAGLKKGHRSTARERATGKRKTKNARRTV